MKHIKHVKKSILRKEYLFKERGRVREAGTLNRPSGGIDRQDKAARAWLGAKHIFL
jgi:hypothetical protein